MSFPMNEDDDLLLEQYEMQITDEDPDPIRSHGSVHRGAAYLDPNYPPHGASGGQEGGSMRPEENVSVFGEDEDDAFTYSDKDVREAHEEAMSEVLGSMLAPAPAKSGLGETGDAYCHGLDVLGAGPVSNKPPRRAGIVMKKAPNGGKYTSLVLTRPKVGNFKASIANANDAGSRAIAVGKKIQKLLSKEPATKVHGAGPINPRRVPGPVRRTKKKYTKQQMARIAAQVIKSGQDAVAHAKKFDAALKTTQAKTAAGVTAFRNKVGRIKAMSTSAKALASSGPASAATKRAPLAGKGAVSAIATARNMTRVHGTPFHDNVVDCLGAHEEIMYDEIFGASAAERLAEVMGDDALPVDTSATDAAPTDSSFQISDMPAADPGEMPTTPPPRDPTEYQADPFPGQPWNDPVNYTSLPKGAIPFMNIPEIGKSVTPDFGSANRFSKAFGVQVSNTAISDKYRADNSDVGFDYTQDGWQKYDPHSRHPSGYEGLAASEARDVGNSSYNEGYGPIVGRPNSAFAGLRYIENAPNTFDNNVSLAPGKILFWFWDTAPPQYRQADDQARLAQAQADWKAQKAIYDTDQANRAAADYFEQAQADAFAKQQAKDDAAAEHKREQEQKQAESDAAVQKAQDEAQLAADKAAAEAASELSSKEAAQQTDLDIKQAEALQRMEEERQAREEERYFDLAKRADAAAAEADQTDAAPADDGAVDYTEDQAATDVVPSDEGDGGYAFDEGPTEEVDAVDSAETLLGAFVDGRAYGADKIRARRSERRR